MSANSPVVKVATKIAVDKAYNAIPVEQEIDPEITKAMDTVGYTVSPHPAVYGVMKVSGRLHHHNVEQLARDESDQLKKSVDEFKSGEHAKAAVRAGAIIARASEMGSPQ